MRKKQWVACPIIVCVVLLCTAILHAASQDVVVNGTGDPAVDVPAVQQAVEGGGRVLLNGVFDFGRDGSIRIAKDVDIIGRVDPQGRPATRIHGGRWTFQSPLPEVFPPAAPGPKIAIRNIHFQGAWWAPISLSYCRGGDIRNLTISDVQPFDIHTPFFGREGVLRQQGIVFYPPYTLPKDLGKYQSGLLTGDIVVADNRIDLYNHIPDMTVAQGILVAGATGANIRVLGNQITNVSRNAVECIDNYPGPGGEGWVLIHGNRITTPKRGITLPSPATPNGIVVGWFMDLTGASDPARRLRIVVSGNRIETRGDASIGIIAIADGAVITANRLVLNGGGKARGVLHFNSGAVIDHNCFEGSGQAGVMVTPWKNFGGDRNTLIGNMFSAFKAVAADVILESSDNIVLGECRTAGGADMGNLVFGGPILP